MACTIATQWEIQSATYQALALTGDATAVVNMDTCRTTARPIHRILATETQEEAKAGTVEKDILMATTRVAKDILVILVATTRVAKGSVRIASAAKAAGTAVAKGSVRITSAAKAAGTAVAKARGTKEEEKEEKQDESRRSNITSPWRSSMKKEVKGIGRKETRF